MVAVRSWGSTIPSMTIPISPGVTSRGGVKATGKGPLYSGDRSSLTGVAFHSFRGGRTPGVRPS